MDATFFLGSGISLPSGLPTVTDLTNNLFEKSYFENYEGETIKQIEGFSQNELTLLQDFLKQLKKIQDNYLVKKVGLDSESNYEDLFYLLEQIRNEKKRITLNPALSLFIEKTEKLSVRYRKEYKKPIPLASFCEKCMDLIHTVIRQGLLDTEAKEMDNLVEIAKKGIKLKIFTTNHDTLIEKLFTKNGIKFQNGFSKLDRDVRWYKPEVYDNKYCNHIYHLHGAKNWKRLRLWNKSKGNYHRLYSSGGVYDRANYIRGRKTFKGNDFEEILGIISTEEFDYLQTKNGKDVTTVTDKGYILIGTGKSSKYHFGVYEDLQSRFRDQLRSINHIIISGYGWNDYAINKKLVAWLQNNRNNKILLIHKYPDKMVENSRYLPNDFLDRYSDQIEKENHWFGEISSVDIMGFLL